jgi:hypothetical protein
MSQSIRTWFANEAKTAVGDTAQEVTESNGLPKARKKKLGKVWNKRLVAAEVHKK